MRHQWLTTSLAVALIASLGAGCTEDRGLGLGSPDTPAGRSQTLANPTSALIGKDVVDLKGDRIGEVSAITEDRVIVETGGFLGIGARQVALDSRQLATIGSGTNMKLQTTMTREQLQALPEVRSESRSRSY